MMRAVKGLLNNLLTNIEERQAGVNANAFAPSVKIGEAASGIMDRCLSMALKQGKENVRLFGKGTGDAAAVLPDTACR